MRTLSILACTAAMAVIGLYLGYSVHGESLRAVFSTLSGAVGGLGIGLALIDIHRRWLNQLRGCELESRKAYVTR